MNNTKVLVIDDSPLERRVFEQAFKARGMDVMTLGEPLNSLEVVKEFKPDFIVLDLYMPDISGFEVCTGLKIDPETKDIPIIFVTGSDSIEDASRSIHMGIIDYFHKPVSIDHLVDQVVTHNVVEGLNQIMKPLQSSMRSFCDKYKDGI